MLDELKGETQDAKDEVRQMLLEADKQLAPVLGQNAQRQIQAANQRPVVAVGKPSPPQAGARGAESGSQAGRSTTLPPKKPPAPLLDARSSDQSDQNGNETEGDHVRTRIVRALLDALDDVKDEDPEVKNDLRKALLEADKQLRAILGKNSQRKILKANQKPPIPVVGRPAKPETKPKTEPERAQKP